MPVAIHREPERVPRPELVNMGWGLEGIPRWRSLLNERRADHEKETEGEYGKVEVPFPC